MFLSFLRSSFFGCWLFLAITWQLRSAIDFVHIPSMLSFFVLKSSLTFFETSSPITCLLLLDERLAFVSGWLSGSVCWCPSSSSSSSSSSLWPPCALAASGSSFCFLSFFFFCSSFFFSSFVFLSAVFFSSEADDPDSRKASGKPETDKWKQLTYLQAHGKWKDRPWVDPAATAAVGGTACGVGAAFAFGCCEAISACKSNASGPFHANVGKKG